MSVSIGTNIDSHVSSVFQEMKAHSLHRFIILKITPDWTTVEVDYPPKPSPELQLACDMLNRGKHRGATAESSHDDDEAVAELIGPELAVLPPEIFTHVLEFCSAKSLTDLAATSSYWRNRVVYDRDLWQKISDKERQRLGMGWNQSWEGMRSKLPQDDCRFVVYMWERDPKRFIPLFIIWAPDGSRVRAKMVYCSTAYTLKRLLDVAAEVQATSFEELNAAFVEDTLNVRGSVRY